MDFVIAKGIEHFDIDISQTSTDCMADFEGAERNAIVSTQNPNGGCCKGCGFHYCQGCLGNIKTKKLYKRYKDNYGFRWYIRKYMMLMLLPVNKVQEAWKDRSTYKYVETEQERQDLLAWIDDYHYKTWMKGGKNKLKDWNLYRVKMRTNNLAENTNRKLSQLLGKHPQLFEWMMGIQRMAALTQCRWIQLQEHDKTRLRKPNERQKNETLNDLWDLLDSGELTTIQFLECASCAYKNKFDALQRRVEEMTMNHENN